MNEIFKIMLIGDISTGKTSFLTQLIYQNPQKMPKSTIELSFFTLRLSSPPSVVQVWDTPGDQKHAYKALSILQPFKAALIFIDATNEHTLNRAKIIIDQLKVYPKIAIYMILSKMDIIQKMPYKRKVTTQEVQSIAISVNGLHFQYSQRERIEQILQKIILHYNDRFSNSNKNRKEDKKIFNQDRRKVEKSNSTENQFCQCVIL